MTLYTEEDNENNVPAALETELSKLSISKKTSTQKWFHSLPDTVMTSQSKILVLSDNLLIFTKTIFKATRIKHENRRIFKTWSYILKTIGKKDVSDW